MAGACCTEKSRAKGPALDRLRTVLGMPDVDEYKVCKDALIPADGDTNACRPKVGGAEWVQVEQDYGWALDGIVFGRADQISHWRKNAAEIRREIAGPIAARYLLRAFDNQNGGIQWDCRGEGVELKKFDVALNAVAFSGAVEPRIRRLIRDGADGLISRQNVQEFVERLVSRMAKRAQGIILGVTVSVVGPGAADGTGGGYEGCFKIARDAHARDRKNGAVVTGVSGFVVLDVDRESHEVGIDDVVWALVKSSPDSEAETILASVQNRIDAEFGNSDFARQARFQPVWIQFQHLK